MGTGRGKETRICNTKDSTKIYYHYYSRRSFSVLILQINQKKRNRLEPPWTKAMQSQTNDSDRNMDKQHQDFDKVQGVMHFFYFLGIQVADFACEG